ncbi:unnamed protein product [Parascedosporium putredinis]|uniref:Uncharacterized protein n=1 Tax=Parascedosporium putredinis TaxID=1442378 RepID=A0A9P1H1T3_9PEZI|nr:unnamed protein product [Parascedosporium putredinis]CAI7993953.1 unnamed protein product [Parascedosporium putredinis]
MVDRPVETAKHVYSHAKQVGKGIGSDAKRGNILGAAVGVIRGAVSIPVSAAIGLVHATVSAPLSTLSAVAKKPQTPRERAVAYLAVANRDWLQARGLRAEIMDSGELGDLVGASAEALVNCAGTAGSADAAGQLKALQKYLKPLEFKEPGDLQLGVDSLWLVLT